MPETYAEQSEQRLTLRLRELSRALPDFCIEYFRGIQPETSPLTRLNYAYDFRTFFEFLRDEIPAFQGKQPIELTYADLERLTSTHIELYLEYLSLYVQTKQAGDTSPAKMLRNNQAGKMRKLSSIRSLFHYLFKKERLSRNVADLVPMPKLHEKPITRLEVNEIARLLDIVEDGSEQLSARQNRYRALTRERDLALLTLLLGTGIRISECIGLNLEDMDFQTNAMRIRRKGGNETVLYFSEEVAEALQGYLKFRLEAKPLAGHEAALFLSLQNKRLGVRAAQDLTKKYARIAAPLKKISPHKLRSTFGTQLYQETGDIYLVADVLGHTDVNTTRKHYAAISDSARRQAASRVRLRDDD